MLVQRQSKWGPSREEPKKISQKILQKISLNTSKIIIPENIKFFFETEIFFNRLIESII